MFKVGQVLEFTGHTERGSMLTTSEHVRYVGHDSSRPSWAVVSQYFWETGKVYFYQAPLAQFRPVRERCVCDECC